MQKTDKIMSMDGKPTNGDDISDLVSKLKNQKFGGIIQLPGIEKSVVFYNNIPIKANIVLLRKGVIVKSNSTMIKQLCPYVNLRIGISSE